MNNAWQRSEKMKNFEPIRFDYDFETDPWEPDKDSAEWILDIAALIDKIYYVLSIEEFTEIFNSRKGYHMDLPEMRKALSIMFYLTMADSVGEFEDDPEEKWDGEEDLDEFLYFLPLRDKKTGIEYVTCLSAPDEEDLLTEYIGIKKTKPLYIPSPEDVTDIHMAEFPIHNKYVVKAMRGLETNFHIPHKEAVVIVLDLWSSFTWSQDPMEKIRELQEEHKKLIPPEINGVRKLVDLVTELYNHTPQIGNNGYPPSELHERMRKEGKYDSTPTIVPISSMAAEGLKAAGIPGVDYSAAVQEIHTDKGAKKIYPNDPCPCGSGKKYKKCCGRNAR